MNRGDNINIGCKNYENVCINCGTKLNFGNLGKLRRILYMVIEESDRPCSNDAALFSFHSKRELPFRQI